MSFFLLVMTVNTACAQNDEARIRAVLTAQQECWNAGDIDCFMESYWKSDELVFVGGSGVTYGWQTVLENYKERYPNVAAMGELSFEIKILEPLSEDFWFMVGQWSLQREMGDIGGYFSLIWRRLGNEWVIVSDHTS